MKKIKEVHLCFPGQPWLDSLFSFTNLFPFSSHLSLLEVSQSSYHYLDTNLLHLWLWLGTLPHISHSQLSQWSLFKCSVCAAELSLNRTMKEGLRSPYYRWGNWSGGSECFRTHLEKYCSGPEVSLVFISFAESTTNMIIKKLEIETERYGSTRVAL